MGSVSASSVGMKLVGLLRLWRCGELAVECMSRHSFYSRYLLSTIHLGPRPARSRHSADELHRLPDRCFWMAGNGLSAARYDCRTVARIVSGDAVCGSWSTTYRSDAGRRCAAKLVGYARRNGFRAAYTDAHSPRQGDTNRAGAWRSARFAVQLMQRDHTGGRRRYCSSGPTRLDRLSHGRNRLGGRRHRLHRYLNRSLAD